MSDASYQVLARKWRPRQFDEVVGQEHVTGTLANAIERGRVAHAYLFVGPRGIGKTSIARIFAKALNCVRGPTPRPCDACDSCLEVAAGSALDVIEIDGASNNSVDQVRDLREKAHFAAARGRFKIYIIDEVHMLSIGAFNALLKLLEEPPPHVKFFFATTEAHRLPATIVSRCQRFDLRRLSVDEIAVQLAKISAAEGVTVSEDACLAIARSADGAMRDAESALDQLISFCGRSVSEPDVLAVFGLVSRERLEALAAAVLGGDLAGVLAIVDAMDRDGVNLGRVPLDLVSLFRDALAVRVAGGESASPSAGWRSAAFRRVVETTDEIRLLRALEVLIDAEVRVRQAASPRTLLEIALLRCARLMPQVSLDEVLKRLDECFRLLGGGEAGTPAAGLPVPPSPDGYRVSEPPGASPPPPPPAAPAPLRGQWAMRVDQIRSIDPPLGEALAGSRLEVVGEGCVDLHLAGPIPLALLEAEHRRKTIEKAAALVIGSPVQVSVVVPGTTPEPQGKDPPNTKRATGNAEAPADPPLGTCAPQAHQAAPDLGLDDGREERRRRMLEDERLRAVLQRFDGTVGAIEP